MNNVVFDFDGVIHSYVTPWVDNSVIPDPPVVGIREAITAIRNKGYKVIVVSARFGSSEGMKAVKEYLSKYEIEVDGLMREKPPAVVYIDDRAIRFNGDASCLLEQIENFKPWNK